MSAVSRRLGYAMAGFLAAAGCLNPVIAGAEDAAGPRYTYFGAGYEWGDSKCAIEPQDTSLSGYTVEGSVGVFDFLHLLGSYYDGESSGTPAGFDQKVDGSCLELGGGLSYSLTPAADIVLRGYWVDVDLDDIGISESGFEPELLVRFLASEKAEIQVGMAYYDIDEEDNTEIRLALIYNVLPWLGVKVGGSVFDDDSSLSLGLRAYFGDNLF